MAGELNGEMTEPANAEDSDQIAGARARVARAH